MSGEKDVIRKEGLKGLNCPNMLCEKNEVR
jgi:hypothetical protein